MKASTANGRRPIQVEKFLKTLQSNCYRRNPLEATNFGVEVMNSEA